jgi:hypothetical protein
LRLAALGPRGRRSRENTWKTEKMLNRGNEAKHLLKTKEIGYFRGQKRTYFSLRKAPNDANNEADEAKFETGKRATGNPDFGRYRAWRGRAA